MANEKRNGKTKETKPTEPIPSQPQESTPMADEQKPEDQKAEDQTTATPEESEEEELEREVTVEDLGTLPEVIQKSIAEGHIVPSWSAVVVTAKSSPNGKRLVGPYIRLDAQDARGMADMNGGKIVPATPRDKTKKEDTRTDEQKRPGAADYHNYGYDLDVRQPIRTALVDEAKGPGAAVKKTVVGLMAAGFERAEIISTVIGSPKFKGVVDEAMVVKVLDSLK